MSSPGHIEGFYDRFAKKFTLDGSTTETIEIAISKMKAYLMILYHV